MSEVCARPGCSEPAWAVLEYSISELAARLTDLVGEVPPTGTPLCAHHADRTSVPQGWELSDARSARVGGRAALFPAPSVSAHRDDESPDSPMLQRAFGSHPTRRRS